MATMLFDLVEPTWRGLADLEYGYWMMRFGEALEKHEDHQGEKGVPPPLAGPVKIIEGGNRMIALAMAAEGRDRLRKAEVDGYRQQADLEVSATVNWVVIRSVLENNPSIRANLLLEDRKEKKRARNSVPAVVTTPTNLKVARSDEHSGIVYISVAKVFTASMYYAQYCQDNPDNEASWIDGAQSDSCRKMQVTGLKPGEIYHFRVRCFGGGQYSPWSQSVTVRIL